MYKYIQDNTDKLYPGVVPLHIKKGKFWGSMYRYWKSTVLLPHMISRDLIINLIRK